MTAITREQLETLHAAPDADALADMLLFLGIAVRSTYQRDPKLKLPRKCAGCGKTFYVWPQNVTQVFYCEECRPNRKRTQSRVRIRRFRERQRKKASIGTMCSRP